MEGSPPYTHAIKPILALFLGCGELYDTLACIYSVFQHVLGIPIRDGPMHATTSRWFGRLISRMMSKAKY